MSSVVTAPKSARGFRKLTPGHLQADKLSSQYNGLPEDVRHPGQILAALKRAAAGLGIPRPVVELVDQLFAHTQVQDWEEGARPIVWPSNRVLMDHLQIGCRALQFRIRQAGAYGLVNMSDSAEGRRYGRRDGEGRIVEAYGFDLAPLAMRYAEMRAMVAASDERMRERKRLRRRLTIAGRRLAQLGAMIEEAPRATDTALLYAEAKACLTTLWQAGEDLAGDAVRGLEATLDRLRDRLDNGSFEQRDSRSRESGFTRNQTTTEPDNKITCTASEVGVVAASARRSAKTEETVPPNPVSEKPTSSFETRVTAQGLLQAFPALAAYAPLSKSPTWPDIVEAASRAGRDLGIPQAVWGDACRVLGRERAAAAIAIVLSKPPNHFSRGPIAYFRGMLKRRETGDLHLDRSIFAQLKRTWAVAASG